MAEIQSKVEKPAKPEAASTDIQVDHAESSPFDTWRTDMERLTGDMFQTWSELGRLSLFSDFLPKAETKQDALGEWKNQADLYFDDLSRRWNDMARLNPFEMMKMPTGIVLNPKVDISDGESELVAKVELPGMEKDDVDVVVDNNVLTISGTKSEDIEDKDNHCCVRERRFGSFRRSFELPEDVVDRKMEAVFDKGILTITVPKKVAPKPTGRKIPVKG